MTSRAIAPTRPVGLTVLGALLVGRLAVLLGARSATGLLSTNLWIVGLDVATLAVVARLLKAEGASLRSVFGRFRPTDVGWGLLLFVAATVALLVGQVAGNLMVYGAAPPTGPVPTIAPWFAWWSLLVLPITVALAEEALYRGYLQPRCSARLGDAAGVLVVAACFALQHLAFATSWPDAPARVLGAFLAGLVWGLAWRRLGRLWPLVLSHWLLDVVGLGLPLLLLAQAG